MVTFNGVKIADIGFYINLDKRLDRKEKIESQLKEFNIEGVNRHSAFSKNSSGPSNCKKSHFDLLTYFVESPHNSMLVLEDDCKFLDFLKVESFEIFNNILKTNWDLFWLGCRNRREPKLYENNCYFVSSVSHAQSYIIKKNFAKYIIENFPIEPQDMYITTAIDELLCLSIYGKEIVETPKKFNFYELNQPLDILQTNFVSLCYEKSLTTQYSSYSDLWGYVTQWEEYITSSFPKK